MNSIDGDACCSSTCSTTRSSGSLQDQPLWKRRAASLPRAARNLQKGFPPRTSSRADEPKEIRINIVKPDSELLRPEISEETNEILYFCTTCEKSYKTRQEWRDHEYEAHERSYFWSCPETGCNQILTSSTLFEKHHQEVHGCQNCPHAYGVKRPLPSKRAWGCGFDRCKGVFDSWEKRCDHVASHFDEMVHDGERSPLPSEWKYTNLMRNLLRQPDVKDAYHRVMVKCHGEDKVFWPRMKWQVHNTTELKRRLEYRDFREGVKQLAEMAVQLGHPAASEAVKIVMDTADSPATSNAPNSPVPQNPNYLSHIDKFPQPGTNPFDLYGPVPPSPIIQLDFLSDINDPDPEIAHLHSTKSSISGIPYSLYPSPSVKEKDMEPSKGPGPFTPPELIHDITVPTEPISFSTAATWSTAFSTGKDMSPPRPKTPLQLIRSASKSLIKKKSQGQIQQQAMAEPFDQVSAQKEIQFYQAR
jgi:hypothetical protein